MAILLIHDRPGHFAEGRAAQRAINGVVSYLEDVAEELRAQGETVIQLALKKGLERRDAPAEGYYLRPSSGLRANPAEQGEIADLLDQLAPRVIHFHGINHVLPSRTIRELAQAWPTLMTFHDVGPFCPRETRLTRNGEVCARRQGLGCITSGCFRPWEHGSAVKVLANALTRPAKLQAMAQMNRALCPSGYIRDMVVQHGIAPGQVQVLPNYSRFAAETTPPPGKNRLLYVGRLTEEKGFGQLVAALRQMMDADWTLSVAGQGPLQAMGQEVLGARVKFLGTVPPDAMKELYQSSDFLAAPYMQPESFGMAGVEALSLARPVLGYPAGGAAVWMRPDYGCVPVTPGDTDALARALRQALQSPPLVDPSRLPFSLPHHVQKLRQHYDEVAQDHG